jgi:ArsR family transcriptional regulator, arsenate/arsenite/antimonite-responsive transcriptional repressor
MAYTKSELFSTELQNCSVLFKALAHPARLAILKYLAETKTCITGDIADELPLGRTTVNQHLKELKDAGLIQGTTEGAKTCYCLNLSNVCELKKKAEKFLSEINISVNFECK